MYNERTVASDTLFKCSSLDQPLILGCIGARELYIIEYVSGQKSPPFTTEPISFTIALSFRSSESRLGALI